MENIGNNILRNINSCTEYDEIEISSNNINNYKLLEKLLDEQIKVINTCDKYCMFISLYHKYFDDLINTLVHYNHILLYYNVFDCCNKQLSFFPGMKLYDKIPESFNNTINRFFNALFSVYNKIMTFKYLSEKYCLQLYLLSQTFSATFGNYFVSIPTYHKYK